MAGVLKGLVTTIIDKYLKDYIENIDSSQFKFNLLDGKVKLKNLSLKPFALDNLYPDFPFAISKGTIGELELVVPWHSLKSRSVECIISGLDLEVIPKKEFNNPELEEERKHSVKLSSLEKYEIRQKLLEQIRVDVEQEEEKLRLKEQEEEDGEGEEVEEDVDSPQSKKERRKKEKKKKEKEKKKRTVKEKKKKKKKKGKIPIIESLVETIINNIRITIHDVKARLVYNLNPSRTFVFGMNVQKISIHSTDENWKVVFLDQIGDMTYKEASLHEFNIFMNTSNDRGRKKGDKMYLFAPIKEFSLKVRMQSLSRNIDFDAPLFNVKLELEKEVIKLQLSDEQYKCFLNVVEYFGKFEPRKEEEKAVETDEKKIVEIRGKYIDLYKKLFLDPTVAKKSKVKIDESEFSSFERQLPLKTLKLYRDCARKEVELQKKMVEERKAAKEEEKKKAVVEQEEESEEEDSDKKGKKKKKKNKDKRKKKKKKKKKGNGLAKFAGKVLGLGKKKKKKGRAEEEEGKARLVVEARDLETQREEILRQSVEEGKNEEDFEPSYDELLKMREGMIKSHQKKEVTSSKLDESPKASSFARFNAEVGLKSLQFTLNKNSTEPLTEVEFGRFQMFVSLKEDGWFARMNMSHFEVTDKSSSSQFSRVIYATEFEGSSDSIDDKEEGEKKEEEAIKDDDYNLMKIEIDRSLNSLKVDVDVRQLTFVVNLELIRQIMSFFIVDELPDFQSFVIYKKLKGKSDRKKKLRLQQQVLQLKISEEDEEKEEEDEEEEGEEEDGKNLDITIRVNIEAPLLYFPVDVKNENTEYFLLDTGKLSLLRDPVNNPNVDRKHVFTLRDAVICCPSTQERGKMLTKIDRKSLRKEEIVLNNFAMDIAVERMKESREIAIQFIEHSEIKMIVSPGKASMVIKILESLIQFANNPIEDTFEVGGVFTVDGPIVDEPTKMYMEINRPLKRLHFYDEGKKKLCGKVSISNGAMLEWEEDEESRFVIVVEKRDKTAHRFLFSSEDKDEKERVFQEIDSILQKINRKKEKKIQKIKGKKAVLIPEEVKKSEAGKKKKKKVVITLGGKFQSILVVVNDRDLKDVAHLYLKDCELGASNKSAVNANFWVNAIELYDNIEEKERKEEELLKALVEDVEGEIPEELQGTLHMEHGIPAIFGAGLKCSVDRKGSNLELDCDFHSLMGKIKMDLVYDCVNMGYDIIDTIDEVSLKARSSFKQDSKREEMKDKTVKVKVKIGGIELGVYNREKKKVTEFEAKKSSIQVERTTDQVIANFEFEDLRASDSVNEGTFYPHILLPREEDQGDGPSQVSLINIHFALVKFAPALSFSKTAKVCAKNLKYVHVQRFVKEFLLMGTGLLKRVIGREKLRRKNVRIEDLRSYLHLDVKMNDLEVFVPECETEHHGLSAICRELTVINSLAEESKIQVLDISTDSIELHEISPDQERIYTFFDGFSFDVNARLCSRSLDPELKFPNMLCAVKIPGLELSLHPGQLRLFIQTIVRNVLSGLSSLELVRELEFVKMVKLAKKEVLNTVTGVYVPPDFLDFICHIEFQKAKVSLSDIRLKEVVELELDNLDIQLNGYNNDRMVINATSTRLVGMDIRKKSNSCFKKFLSTKGSVNFTKTEVMDKIINFTLDKPDVTLTTTIISDLARIFRQMKYKEVTKDARKVIKKLKSVYVEPLPEEFFISTVRNVIVANKQLLPKEQKEEEEEEETEGEGEEETKKKEKEKKEVLLEKIPGIEKSDGRSVTLNVEVKHPRIQVIENFRDPESRSFEVTTNILVSSKRDAKSFEGSLKVVDVTAGMRYPDNMFKTILFPLCLDGKLELLFQDKDEESGIRTYKVGGNLRSLGDKTVSLSYSDLQMGLKVGLRYVQKLRESRKGDSSSQVGKVGKRGVKLKDKIKKRLETLKKRIGRKSRRGSLINSLKANVFDDIDEEKAVEEITESKTTSTSQRTGSGISFNCDMKSDNLFFELVDDVFGYQIPLFNLNLVELSSVVELRCVYEKMNEFYFSLNNTFNTYINYYNFLKNHYEPVLERKEHPIRFCISFEKRRGTIEFLSEDVKFNFSHDMMDNVAKTALLWISQTKKNLREEVQSKIEPLKITSKDFHVPEFGIVNNTGLKVEFWRPKEGDLIQLGRKKIDFDLPLKLSKDQNNAENDNNVGKEYLDELIHLCVWEGKKTSDTIQVRITEVKTMTIFMKKNKKMYASVEAIRGQKVVNLHTGHCIKNCTSDPWNLEILSSSSGISKILGSGETYHFSQADLARNLSVFSGRDGFLQGQSRNLSELMFSNEDQIRISGFCQKKRGIKKKKFYCLFLEKRVFYEEKIVSSISPNQKKKEEPRFYCLEIQTPLSITNLLPNDVDLTLLSGKGDPSNADRLRFRLEQGKSREVHNLDMRMPLSMECHSCVVQKSSSGVEEAVMWKYFGCEKGPAKPVLISPGAVSEEVKNIGNYFIVKDPSGTELRVKMRYNQSRKYSLEVEIYVDFWVINKSCVPNLLVSTPPSKGGGGTKVLVGQGLGREAQAKHRLVLHSSPSKKVSDAESYVQDFLVSVEGKSSDVFTIDMIRKTECVNVGRYDVGVFTSRAPGRYNRSRIIYLTPRYVVVNKTGEDVDICQASQLEDYDDNDDGVEKKSFYEQSTRVKDGKSAPFFREDRIASNSFQFRLVKSSEWCSPYPLETLEDETSILLEVRNEEEEEEGESDDDDDSIPQFDNWRTLRASNLGNLSKKKKKYQPVLIRKLEKEGVVFIELRKTEYPPYSITNLTRMSILIRQKVSHKKKKKKKRDPSFVQKRRPFVSFSPKSKSIPFDLASYDVDAERVLECVIRQKRYFMEMNKIGREIELEDEPLVPEGSERSKSVPRPSTSGGISGFDFPQSTSSTSMSLGIFGSHSGMSNNHDRSKKKVYVGVKAEKGTRNIIFSYDKKHLSSFSSQAENEEDVIVKSIDEFHERERKNRTILEIKFSIRSILATFVSHSDTQQQEKQQEALLKFSATGLGLNAWLNKSHFWMTSCVKTVKAQNEKKGALYRTLLHHRSKKKKRKSKMKDIIQEEDEEEEMDQFLKLSLALCHKERQCMYIPYFSMDMQEVVTKIDFLFLEEMSLFADGFMKIIEEVRDDEFEKNRIISTLWKNTSPEPIKAPLMMMYLYFDKLLVEPVLVNLTFRLNSLSYSTSSSRLKKSLHSRSFQISLILDLATTLGTTIDGSNLQLKSYDLEHEFLSLGQLVRSIVTHYRGNVRSERLKLLRGLLRGRVKRAGNMVSNLYTVRGLRYLRNRVFGENEEEGEGEEGEGDELKRREGMTEEEKNMYFHLIGDFSDGNTIVITRDEEELTYLKIIKEGGGKEEVYFKHKMSEFSKIEWEEKRNTVRVILHLRRAAKKYSDWRFISNALAGDVKNRVIECKRSMDRDVQILKKLSQSFHELKESRVAQMNQKLFK